MKPLLLLLGLTLFGSAASAEIITTYQTTDCSGQPSAIWMVSIKEDNSAQCLFLGGQSFINFRTVKIGEFCFHNGGGGLQNPIACIR